jgi:hypothetical protein
VVAGVAGVGAGVRVGVGDDCAASGTSKRNCAVRKTAAAARNASERSAVALRTLTVAWREGSGSGWTMASIVFEGNAGRDAWSHRDLLPLTVLD